MKGLQRARNVVGMGKLLDEAGNGLRGDGGSSAGMKLAVDELDLPGSVSKPDNVGKVIRDPLEVPILGLVREDTLDARDAATVVIHGSGDATGGVQAEAGSGGTGAVEQGKEMRRELWKKMGRRNTKRVRMLAGKEGDAGIIVKRDEVRSPAEESGGGGIETESGRDPEAGGPGPAGPQRSGSPIEAANRLGHGARRGEPVPAQSWGTTDGTGGRVAAHGRVSARLGGGSKRIPAFIKRRMKQSRRHYAQV